MLKISLLLIGAALAALLFADIGVSTQQPGAEMLRVLGGALTPDLGFLFSDTILIALLNTLSFALCGTFLAVLVGSVLSLFFESTAVRLGCAFVRAIHEIFWAFIFLPVVGLNPVCGVLAIALPYSGIFAKVFAEIRQEADRRPLAGIPAGTSALSRFCFASLPVIYADLKHYTAYRFECALRSSAVLGFIGLPTLGYHLETAFREGMYGQAAAILYLFYLLIASKKYWTRPRLTALLVCVAFIFLSTEITFSLDNVKRFFFYDILPWPMRREGVLDSTRTLAWPLRDIIGWGWDIFRSQGLEGIVNTILLTQIALAATGVLAAIGFPFASIHFSGRWIRRAAQGILIVMRTTPEYMLAYLFVQLWGPSMLPAIVAIALHNGAILAHLSSRNADGLTLRADAPQKRPERYLFEILPRIYGRFLAFLFYRWEVIMRESALLGILGIYTLGFYIDSAMADHHLDTVIWLLLLTAGLNMVIDTFSQRIRRQLRISDRLTSAARIN